MMMVEVVKQDREVQKKEMKFRELLRYERDEGREEGREEERLNTLREKTRADEAEKRAKEAERKLKELECRMKNVTNEREAEL